VKLVGASEVQNITGEVARDCVGAKYCWESCQICCKFGTLLGKLPGLMKVQNIVWEVAQAVEVRT